MNVRRLLTPSLFALAAILFLFPFFSVSCTGQLVRGFEDLGVPPSQLRFELTGLDLVLGRVPDPEARGAYTGLEGPGTAHPLAIALGVTVLGGVLLSGLPRRAGGWAGVGLGLAGIALLILLAMAVDEEVHQRTVRTARDLVFVRWEMGAWGVSALLTGAVLHALLRVLRIAERAPPS